MPRYPQSIEELTAENAKLTQQLSDAKSALELAARMIHVRDTEIAALRRRKPIEPRDPAAADAFQRPL